MLKITKNYRYSCDWCGKELYSDSEDAFDPKEFFFSNIEPVREGELMGRALACLSCKGVLEKRYAEIVKELRNSRANK